MPTSDAADSTGAQSDWSAIDARRAELLNERDRRRLSPVTLRAALWALASFVRARRDLRRLGLATTVKPPPRLPWGAKVGVMGVLNRTRPTCLERAMVLQAWLLAHGMPHDIIIGVAPDAGSMKAHAWVDGIATGEEANDYTPIHRIIPRPPS